MRENKQNLLFFSPFPIVLYIWLTTSLIMFAFVIFYLRGSINYFPTLCIISFILYYLFCRKSCKIQVYEDKFIIHQLFWNEGIEIKFCDIIKMDYKKGFFDFKAPIDNTYHFKLICFDSFFLELKSGNIQLNINTRLGGFNKLKNTISKKLSQKLLN